MHHFEVIPLAFFAMVTTITVGLPIARAFARRMDQRGAQPRIPSEVLARLERMEQAIDSVAVEVERISEGQRFTTKLLSERANGQLSPAIAPSASAPSASAPSASAPRAGLTNNLPGGGL